MHYISNDNDLLYFICLMSYLIAPYKKKKKKLLYILGCGAIHFKENASENIREFCAYYYKLFNVVIFYLINYDY
jgi:hypothetical protein